MKNPCVVKDDEWLSSLLKAGFHLNRRLMVISVVITIVPHHHVRSRTSHLFGGVYSMVPVQPGGSISK